MVVLLLGVTYGALRVAGSWRQGQSVKEAGRRLRAGAPMASLKVSYAELDQANVPPIVRAYLKRSLKDGGKSPRFVHLFQQGGFRLKPDAPFMEMRAEQWFTVGGPGLLWQATMGMAPGLPILVRDQFIDGHGEFGGRIFGLIEVASGTGAEVDKASLIRYLSEAVWFPYALFPSDWLAWEPKDDRSAVAVLTFQGIAVRGVFGFADDGRPLTFDADRPMDDNGKSIPTAWHVLYESHAIMSGMEIPKSGNVSWILPAGPFEYGQFEITALDVEPSPVPGDSASGS
jgi:hypothetical protein